MWIYLVIDVIATLTCIIQSWFSQILVFNDAFNRDRNSSDFEREAV